MISDRLVNKENFDTDLNSKQKIESRSKMLASESINRLNSEYQPRGLPQQNSLNMEITLQFPSNQLLLNTDQQQPFHNPNYHPQIPSFPNNSSMSFNQPPLHQSKQLLPQLNFPLSLQNSQSFSNPSSTYNNYSSFTPIYPTSDLPYQQNRSHFYGGDLYANRHLNWTPDQQYQMQHQAQYQYAAESSQHRPERFTDEDIRVLKSLLFNGERVKWRYISSKLSSVSGRRATATACAKKTRELFKLPSEKAAGSLGTSLPYVVHNTWDEIPSEKEEY